MRRTPTDIAQSSRQITRRMLLLGTAQVALVAALGLRMRQLQVEEADNFRLLAEENRVNIRLIAPERGSIYDRVGRPLAENVRNYRIVMVREEAGDVDAVLADLQKVITVPEETLEKAKQAMRRRSPFVPVTIMDQLSWDEIAEVAVNSPALPGVSVEVGFSRTYPIGSDFAHIVGYVGPVSQRDLNREDDKDPLLQIPRFQVGKTGVEARMERSLRGRAGTRRIEVNASGRVMRELDRSESQTGDDLQLTIEANLQNYVQARLDASGESVSAVVMDVTNGDILAVGSSPTFDPNLFVRGISQTDYNALINNPFRPLTGKAVQDTVAPASTFKMVTMLAALEAGVITPDERIDCPGHLEVFDRRFHCWKRSGHGKVNMHNSLKQSCDVYYYDVAQRVGIENISAMARRLGLGIRPEVPLSAVQRGVAPTKDWKKQSYDRDWVVGDTVNASIGQGFVLSSNMQLAIMTARLATGRAVEPRLIMKRNGIDTPSGAGEDMGINPEHLQIVRRAMEAVSNDRNGTAYKVRIVADDYRMAGKTGTSQNRQITAAERRTGVIRNEDLPWDKRDDALFVCYAPMKDPKIAVSVVVEHGGGGSTAAAPIARDLVLRALSGQDLPPIGAYPSKDRRNIAREQRNLELTRRPNPGGTSAGRA